MSEKRKLPLGGLAMAGSGLAVVAAVGAVMIATNNNSEDAAATDALSAVETPAAPSVDGADPIVSAQSAPVAPTPPDPGAAQASTDGGISYSDANMAFSASFPEGPADDPVIASLRKEAQDLLATAKRDAQAAAEERGGASSMEWEYRLEWKELARSGDLVSLVGDYYTFTGGAHGMTSTDTRILKAGTAQEVEFSSMMRYAKTPSPAVVIAGCEAVKKAKIERTGSATVFDEPIVCAGSNANVRLEDASIALAPSNAAGKFGGLYVYFDQYKIGAYAEGPYQIAIQQEVFAEDLRPEFKSLFAGTAPPPQ